MATLPFWTSVPYPTDSPKSFRLAGRTDLRRDLAPATRADAGRADGGTGGAQAGTGGNRRVGRLRG